jgi:hypothetical protein
MVSKLMIGSMSLHFRLWSMAPITSASMPPSEPERLQIFPVCKIYYDMLGTSGLYFLQWVQSREYCVTIIQKHWQNISNCLSFILLFRDKIPRPDGSVPEPTMELDNGQWTMELRRSSMYISSSAA